MLNRMESIKARIAEVNAAISKFRAHRSQSDPTFRQDFRDLQDELLALKKLEAALKQNSANSSKNVD